MPLPPPEFDTPDADWKAKVRALAAEDAARLAARAVAARLFAHAYAFHLNFRFGGFRPADLLRFASDQGLAGVKIHVEDGEGSSLSAASATARRDFAEEAADLGLEVHVETSSTGADDLRLAVEIAHAVGATSLRFYPRHAGPVSQVMARTIEDLALLHALDPDGRLRFTLEQHEDLRSAELVDIVRRVNHPRLSLLFDFGNMVNASETPLAALAAQAGLVTEVHVKDCLVVPDRGGWGHVACATDTGHIPMRALLVRLLLLGGDAAQVRAFALEEEEEYFAPAFRFPGEGADPVIPHRGPSETPFDPGKAEERLAREREAAMRQVRVVRSMLAEIADEAVSIPARR